MRPGRRTSSIGTGDALGLGTPLQLATDALHAVLNEIGHPVVLMTAAGLVLESNDAMTQVLGRGLDRAELRYCPFLHEEDGALIAPDFFNGALETGQRQERKLQRFGRWWHVHLVPLRGNQGSVDRLLLLAQDITSIKEEQNSQVERQKALTGVLLREVHHRIKNHLQGLVGLLRFHAASARSVEQLVDAACAQILSVAAVHSLLSVHNDSVDLKQLVAQIVDSLRGTSTIPLTLQPVTGPGCAALLTKEEAVPYAVSIAELVTNAARHTRYSAAASVSVKLTVLPEHAEIEISNQPATLPAGFTLPKADAPPSGLVLIQTLLPRERAHLTIRQQNERVVTLLRIALAAPDPAPGST